MPEPTVFDVSVSDGVTVIHLCEDLFDQQNIALLRERLLELITQEQPKKVLISFDRVQLCGSETIGILVHATTRVRSLGGDVRLCSMSDRIEKIYKTVKLIPNLYQLYRSSGEGISSYE